MKKMNNKGFTIVELVIVIAVIAILAAVMIPTFSGIIEKANSSAVQQKAAAAFKEMYARDMSDGKCDGKENSGTAAEINLVAEATAAGNTYTVGTGDTDVSFIYVEGDFTATFDGTNWYVVKDTE